VRRNTWADPDAVVRAWNLSAASSLSRSMEAWFQGIRDQQGETQDEEYECDVVAIHDDLDRP